MIVSSCKILLDNFFGFVIEFILLNDIKFLENLGVF